MNMNDELLPGPGQLRPQRHDAQRVAEGSLAAGVVAAAVLAGVDAGAVRSAET